MGSYFAISICVKVDLVLYILRLFSLAILTPGEGIVPGTARDRPISLGNFIGKPDFKLKFKNMVWYLLYWFLFLD